MSDYSDFPDYGADDVVEAALESYKNLLRKARGNSTSELRIRTFLLSMCSGKALDLSDMVGFDKANTRDIINVFTHMMGVCHFGGRYYLPFEEEFESLYEFNERKIREYENFLREQEKYSEED